MVLKLSREEWEASHGPEVARLNALIEQQAREIAALKRAAEVRDETVSGLTATVTNQQFEIARLKAEGGGATHMAQSDWAEVEAAKRRLREADALENDTANKDGRIPSDIFFYALSVIEALAAQVKAEDGGGAELLEKLDAEIDRQLYDEDYVRSARNNDLDIPPDCEHHIVIREDMRQRIAKAAASPSPPSMPSIEAAVAISEPVDHLKAAAARANEETETIRQAIKSLDIEAAVAAEREAIEATARRYASCYPEGSDGRNTFILLADWIAARASSPPSMPGEGWMPIETAPDATSDVSVIIYGGAWPRPTVVPADGGWWRVRKREGSKGAPTHWIPLPSPPVSKTEELDHADGTEPETSR